MHIHILLELSHRYCNKFPFIHKCGVLLIHIIFVFLFANFIFVHLS